MTNDETHSNLLHEQQCKANECRYEAFLTTTEPVSFLDSLRYNKKT